MECSLRYEAWRENMGAIFDVTIVASSAPTAGGRTPPRRGARSSAPPISHPRRLLGQSDAEGVLRMQAVYGYFPARAEGDERVRTISPTTPPPST
ncbi:hypothetical protein [Endothiovibrio diazotrophicus]